MERMIAVGAADIVVGDEGEGAVDQRDSMVDGGEENSSSGSGGSARSIPGVLMLPNDNFESPVMNATGGDRLQGKRRTSPSKTTPIEEARLEEGRPMRPMPPPLPSPLGVESSSPRLRKSSSSPMAATAPPPPAGAARQWKQQDERTAAAAATGTPGPAIPPNSRGRRLRIYPTGRSRTNKWVTREIAALDFLTGLRMCNEAAILADGTGGGGGGAGGGSGGSSGWGWDAKGSGSENNSSRQASPTEAGKAKSAEVVRVASPAAGDGRKRVAGRRLVARDGMVSEDFRDHSSGTGAAGARGTIVPSNINNTNNTDGDDSDSDNGWLDQPSTERGIGGIDGRNTSTTQRLRAVSTRGNNAAIGGDGAGGRMPGTGAGSAAPARRLRGREAAHIRLPPTFRYSMESLPGHSAAVVRQWEQGLTQQDRLLEGRMFFSRSKGYPIMVSSVIHYKPQEEQAKRARQKLIDERGAEAFQVPKRDWRGFSYAHLLPGVNGDLAGDIGRVGAAAVAASSSVGVVGVGGGGASGGGFEQGESKNGGVLLGGGGSVNGAGVMSDDGVAGGEGTGGGDGAGGEVLPYKAGFLDDPALKVGRHRHMTRGDQHTGPVVSSVLLFVKPRVLKDELNARFREEHPWLPPSLTLSKIRSVKRQALLGCYRANMEVATVALACIYFERLCLAGVVTKPNRRLAMAACLAIAYKFNEAVLEGDSKLPALWAFVDQEWQVSKKRVLEAEFGVLVQLSFDLHADPRDIFHHFALLLKMIESNANLYLGEEMMELHQESLETFRDSSSDDGTVNNAGGDGGGGAAATNPDSPGRARTTSASGVTGIDSVGSGRSRVQSSQKYPFLETSSWFQRRATNSTPSGWLVGWRAGVATATAAHETMPRTGRGQEEQLILLAPALSGMEAGAGAEAGAGIGVVGGSDRWSATAAAAKLAKLRAAGRDLGKETRQRGQKLNKNVRSGASTFLTLGIMPSSVRKRRSRRRMEA